MYELEEFIEYFDSTWIKDGCHFNKEIWNIFKEYSSRTNNICESYNHKVNSGIISAKSNIYKVLDLVKKEECLTSVAYEKVNIRDNEKKGTNAQQVKDAKIDLLKCEYENGKLDVMDYLFKVSDYGKNYDE